ncbi:hypothetical protein BS47DRAFT_141219 [Hydnum rufescens UP504]|uniref:Uncharacterized protein n=1 Tax=Hydnum rufescens UP504 TaxID=1448309 RepID=A0A9P6APS6_9AGAM|nr:hypothetical protein BS47DRAFT_141219 [Hydnum rufescens UP504]
MGYLIDIIVVMSCLFALVDSRGLDRISPAIGHSRAEGVFRHKGRGHEQVKLYVNDTKFPGLRPKRAIDRISVLVKVGKYKELDAAVILAASRTLDDEEISHHFRYDLNLVALWISWIITCMA